MISELVRRYMAYVVVAVTILAFFVDGSFTSWVQNETVLGGEVSINHLLMVVMFGMGLTGKVGVI